MVHSGPGNAGISVQIVSSCLQTSIDEEMEEEQEKEKVLEEEE